MSYSKPGTRWAPSQCTATTTSHPAADGSSQHLLAGSNSDSSDNDILRHTTPGNINGVTQNLNNTNNNSNNNTTTNSINNNNNKTRRERRMERRIRRAKRILSQKQHQQQQQQYRNTNRGNINYEGTSRRPSIDAQEQHQQHMIGRQPPTGLFGDDMMFGIGGSGGGGGAGRCRKGCTGWWRTLNQFRKHPMMLVMLTNAMLSLCILLPRDIVFTSYLLDAGLSCKLMLLVCVL